MHHYDVHCRWCDWETPYETYRSINGYEYRAYAWQKRAEHVCPLKPPLTPEQGAAVAFGLLGMAEAIRGREMSNIEQCAELNAYQLGYDKGYDDGSWNKPRLRPPKVNPGDSK